MVDTTTTSGRYVESTYERDTSYLDRRITAQPQTNGDGDWPVGPGRYRLVVSRACPWASRAVIVRRLLGLEDALSMGIAGPTHGADSWQFDLDPGRVDPVLQIPRLKDAFERAVPGYERGITVPAMVDIASGAVVTNDFAQLTLDLSTEWRAHHRAGAPDLLPAQHQAELDEVMERIYRQLNNGVYRAGFAGTQASYEDAYRGVFECLDWLELRLADQRYLVGDTITEADVRLFTTLVRFDAVYHGHFKCNRNKLTEMPVLWAYARDLFATPGFGDTVDFDHIKRHYYCVHTDINPTGVVPAGPALYHWATPHLREELGGRPFGAGTAPGPVSPAERVSAAHNPVLELL